MWQTQNKNYSNRTARDDAWASISVTLGAPVEELKKKMESLMGSYRREKSREKKSHITGSGMHL